MVNRDWTARPRSPLSNREFWQRSPPTLPTQTPSAPPAGFLVFGPLRFGDMLDLCGGARQVLAEALAASQAPRRPLRWAIPQNCDGYHCRPKRLLAN